MKLTSGKVSFTDDEGPFPTEGTIEVGPNSTEITMSIPREMMNTFMIGLVEWFIANGGENYIEQHLHSAEHGAFTVLVQKYRAETPAQQNTRLRAELAAARKDSARLAWIILTSTLLLLERAETQPAVIAQMTPAEITCARECVEFMLQTKAVMERVEADNQERS